MKWFDHCHGCEVAVLVHFLSYPRYHLGQRLDLENDSLACANNDILNHEQNAAAIMKPTHSFYAVASLQFLRSLSRFVKARILSNVSRSHVREGRQRPIITGAQCLPILSIQMRYILIWHSPCRLFRENITNAFLRSYEQAAISWSGSVQEDQNRAYKTYTIPAFGY